MSPVARPDAKSYLHSDWRSEQRLSDFMDDRDRNSLSVPHRRSSCGVLSPDARPGLDMTVLPSLVEYSNPCCDERHNDFPDYQSKGCHLRSYH